MPEAHPINDDREITRWAMYSFANHAWVTTVGTVLIGPWLLALAKKAAGSGHATLFTFGPWHLSASAYPSFILTVAALLQVLVLPAVGASVDALSVKKKFLAISCVVGSFIAALLATTGGAAWLYAGIVFLAGSIVFGTSNVVYNAFLPHLTTRDRRDAASSKGFAIGYLGSGLLLALNLILLKVRGSFGMSESTAVRICFVSAGVWWAAFGLWAIRGLRERKRDRTGSIRGLRELRATLAVLRTMPQALRYLIAYLFFSDAISAVIGLASTYITHELYDDNATKASTFLFSLILLIQFLAIGGSLFFARLARRSSTKNAIVVALVIWCFVIIYAYLAMHSKVEAVAMGIVLALVLGGSQALSRSLFSQMVPAGREATFFGLYEICDRGTSWIAPALFTIVVNVTGSFRQAILSLIVLFVVGLILLVRTDVDRACDEASAIR
ncbi:MAG TPA: MFS transporter [Mycobacteriales bacterium]|nr:MFS transporter [Mycobacteriales bacterium]